MNNTVIPTAGWGMGDSLEAQTKAYEAITL